MCFVVVFVSCAWMLPVLQGTAFAATGLVSRSLNISSGQSAATGVTYTYSFTTQNASAIQSIKFVACTTAVDTYNLGGGTGTGTCTAPNLQNINLGTQASATFTNAGGWTRTTSSTGKCAPANNVLCVTRTQATSEPTGAKSIGWNTQTNPTIPSGNGYTFYVGIYIYTDNAYATLGSDSGTVASAVVQTLTINAAVAEVLNFCVGSTTVNSDSSGTVAADCSAVSGTSVNLGTLDTSKTNVTPESTNCSPADCGKNGTAMLRSNSLNGTVVYYDSIQQSGTNHKGTLRISGATCTADTANASTDSTDQCFNQRPAQATFTAGTERFGMTIAGVNCGSTTSYTCTGTGTANLVRDAAYDGTGSSTYPTDTDQISGTTNAGYAWDESGTATQIASSSSSTIKEVDDEALILKFAATPTITTPFGSYTAQADFIAVSTY